MKEESAVWGAPFAVDPTLPPPFPAGGRGSTITVGTFDGVHRGHQQVLAEIVHRAERSGRRSVLVTFEPHPLRVVRPEAAPPALTTAPEKREILAQTGVECAVFLPFTPVLQHYPPRRFVEEILLERLGLGELVIGYDHGFGRDRGGSVETIREIGREIGFEVDVVEAVRAGEDNVSSTRIRKALADGSVAEAARGLGRLYSVEGLVVHGARRGRELGFPTANIRVADPHKMLPREGVYAVYGWVQGSRIPGLLHRGPRPTFEDLPASVELHLLDWGGDLYGQTVRVEFVEWLRPITAFPSAEALVDQMRLDEAAARGVLAVPQR